MKSIAESTIFVDELPDLPSALLGRTYVEGEVVDGVVG
jgi:hypothetical protein